jgi:hypothetical protein
MLIHVSPSMVFPRHLFSTSRAPTYRKSRLVHTISRYVKLPTRRCPQVARACSSSMRKIRMTRGT